MMRPDFLIGTACGAVAAAVAMSLLFGAQGRMRSSRSGAWPPDVYYTVGEKRFDWFGKSGPNCWGGHTLDGRCISATYVSSGHWSPPAARFSARAADIDWANKIDAVTAKWQHAYSVWQSVYFVHFDKQMRAIDRKNASTQAILDATGRRSTRD